MPKVFDVRYGWFGGCAMWDGARWVHFNKELTRRQRKFDALRSNSERLLASLNRQPCSE